MENKIEFNAQALIEARKRAGMTQQQLGKLVHCRRQWIAMVESGFHRPNIRTLEKILNALGVEDVRPFFMQEDVRECTCKTMAAGPPTT